MSISVPLRRVHVTKGSGDGFAVPEDVARVLGDDARMEIGPGRVVTLRPGRITQADLAAVATPLTMEQLMPATTPLTDAERAALAEFLQS
jgi:hypothetical protein